MSKVKSAAPKGLLYSYGAITKSSLVDPADPDSPLIVEGYCSTPEIDDQYDLIPNATMKAALADYMKWGALTEQHDSDTAPGTAIEAYVDDRGTYLKSKIVDPIAKQKVLEGVYKAYSIAFRFKDPAMYLKKGSPAKPRICKDIEWCYTGLVTRPSNPGAALWFAKAAGLPDMVDLAAGELTETAADEAAETPEEQQAEEAAGVELPAAESIRDGILAYQRNSLIAGQLSSAYAFANAVISFEEARGMVCLAGAPGDVEKAGKTISAATESQFWDAFGSWIGAMADKGSVKAARVVAALKDDSPAGDDKKGGEEPPEDGSKPEEGDTKDMAEEKESKEEQKASPVPTSEAEAAADLIEELLEKSSALEKENASLRLQLKSAQVNKAYIPLTTVEKGSGYAAVNDETDELAAEALRGWLASVRKR